MKHTCRKIKTICHCIQDWLHTGPPTPSNAQHGAGGRDELWPEEPFTWGKVCLCLTERERDKVREMLVHLLYYIYVSACAGPSALGVRSWWFCGVHPGIHGVISARGHSCCLSGSLQTNSTKGRDTYLHSIDKVHVTGRPNKVFHYIRQHYNCPLLCI